MGSLSGGKRHTTRQRAAARVPRLVQWMVTGSCPLSCPHCLAAGPTGGPELDLRQGAELIAQVAAMGVDELLITGGEPLARPDLPRIVALLEQHGQRWSLNTAVMPHAAARAAMERWPPAFVAVSLDGPAEIHDRFRGRAGSQLEALQSIAYYRALVGDRGGVAAGTTVTARNIDHLGETFALVLGSGASSWGLHLVVPEGRAAQGRDLLLSRGQLDRLVRFAAAKRNHFPVVMADEIGYCGALEPLLRDEPFYCGAGTDQCVVLPDGEVVPCTTLDRATSAGNLRRRGLGQIWAEGFAELRHWRPEGRCRSCELAAACGGGCWLQRRHGDQCFRPVWQRPSTRSRVTMAVCLGLAAAGIGERTSAQARPSPPRGRPAARQQVPRMELLQQAIVQWYAAEVGGPHAPEAKVVLASLRQALPRDPGARYVLNFALGRRPAALDQRAAAIRQALQTRQISLCLIGLAWRDVMEWVLDRGDPRERSAAERETMRELMTALHDTAERWRRRVFADKLDPFLRRPRRYRRFFLSKAGPRPWQRKIMHIDRVARNVARKRGWTQPAGDISAEFLKHHAHGEVMELVFTVVQGSMPRVLRGGKRVSARGRLRIFDILLVDRALTLRFVAGSAKLQVSLPAAGELTYGDLLRLLQQQNAEGLGALAQRILTSRSPREALPLVLPELRAMERRLSRKIDRAQSPDAALQLQLQRARWWLTDLYLF